MCLVFLQLNMPRLAGILGRLPPSEENGKGGLRGGKREGLGEYEARKQPEVGSRRHREAETARGSQAELLLTLSSNAILGSASVGGVPETEASAFL